jgi:hypothetical protein
VATQKLGGCFFGATMHRFGVTMHRFDEKMHRFSCKKFDKKKLPLQMASF